MKKRSFLIKFLFLLCLSINLTLLFAQIPVHDNFIHGNNYLFADPGFQNKAFENMNSFSINPVTHWEYGPCWSVKVKDNQVFYNNGSYFEIADIFRPDKPLKLSSTLTMGIIEEVFIKDDYAFILNPGKGLTIIDIIDAENPVIKSIYENKSCYLGLYVSGDHAFFGTGNSVSILDISDIENPTKAGYIYTKGTVYDIKINGNYAYIAGYNKGMKIVDISDINNPVEKSSIYSSDKPFYDPDVPHIFDVHVAGNIAYVIDSSHGFKILDISDTSNPVEVGSYDTGKSSSSVYVSGNYAYVTNYNSGLRVIDISDFSNPQEISVNSTNENMDEIVISGNYAFTASDHYGLKIVDISDPTDPSRISELETGGPIRDIHVSGNRAYVIDWGCGLRIMDINNRSNPVTINTNNIVNKGTNISLAGNYAFITDENRNFMSLDISDTGSNIPLDILETDGEVKKLFLKDDKAYLCEWEYGLSIVDISDPGNLWKISSYQTNSFWGEKINSVFVSGGYAYLVDHYRGLLILDVTDPLNIKETGSYINYMPVQVSQSFRDVSVSGNYAYLTDQYNGLFILDIEDKSNPKVLSTVWIQLSNEIKTVENFAFVTTRTGYLCIIDITDPESPKNLGYYGNIEMGRRLHISGDHIYISADYNGFYILNKGTVTDINEKEPLILSEFKLMDNYPNPFNPETNIDFQLPKSSFVSIRIYNILGQEVKTLVNETRSAGFHSIKWDGTNNNGITVNSGVYIYKMKAGDFTDIKKMTLIK